MSPFFSLVFNSFLSLLILYLCYPVLLIVSPVVFFLQIGNKFMSSRYEIWDQMKVEATRLLSRRAAKRPILPVVSCSSAEKRQFLFLKKCSSGSSYSSSQSFGTSSQTLDLLLFRSSFSTFNESCTRIATDSLCFEHQNAYRIIIWYYTAG